MYCSKCGSEIKETDQFCPNCGNPNNVQDNKQPPNIVRPNYQGNNTQNSNETVSPMALGAFICSIVGLFIYGVVLRNNSINSRNNC